MPSNDSNDQSAENIVVGFLFKKKAQPHDSSSRDHKAPPGHMWITPHPPKLQRALKQLSHPQTLVVTGPITAALSVLSAGHPDGVWNSYWVLGPRPRGPAHGAVRCGALQRAQAPRQALGKKLFRGEDPRRWLCDHHQVARPPPRAPKQREVAPRRIHLGKGRSLNRCLDLLPGGLRLSLLPLGSGSGQGDVFVGIKSWGVGVIP